MNQEFVEDDEVLHRALKPNPTFWSTKSNRPSSALFKDSKGVSVDRRGSRSCDEIKKTLLERFPDLLGEVQILTLNCRKQFCKVETNQLIGNIYHALIKGDNAIQLSNAQARQLAKLCKFIEYIKPN